MCQAIIDIKEDAKNKGINKGKIEIEVTLNFIKLGKMSLEEIADVAGFSLNYIKKIVSNQ